MKKTSLAISALMAGLILIGCNSTQSTQNDTSTVRGMVPGTLIEAFCADGSYYKVNSTKSGTIKHPFEIEIPRGVKCNFVMTTNEENNNTRVITPISFKSGDVNGTFITVNGDVLELDYIDLPTDINSVDDNNSDSVVDRPLVVDINNSMVTITPQSLNNMDKDKDGIIDLYEDDDADHVPNHYDDDDDGDGILDINDGDLDNDGINDMDLDNDGIKNKDDVDDDNDGMHDRYDDDRDNDGIRNIDDDDDDNDGIKDKKRYDDHDDDEEDDDD